MEAENIVCIRKLVDVHCNNPEGGQQHYQNMETVTDQYYIDKMENCILFAIKRKLQETSNCPEHSSSNRKSDHNRIHSPSAS